MRKDKRPLIVQKILQKYKETRHIRCLAPQAVPTPSHLHSMYVTEVMIKNCLTHSFGKSTRTITSVSIAL